MKRDQLNIEQMLEQIGSQDTPGDPEHRYDLRRALLCSRYFGETCERQSRWEVLFSYTAPLMAGTAVVGVFVFMATFVVTPGASDVEVVTAEVGVVITEDEQVESDAVLADSSLNVGDFLSDPSDPVVQLADFENIVPHKNVARFIPVHPDAPAAVH